jgi:hypothetical protein
VNNRARLALLEGDVPTLSLHDAKGLPRVFAGMSAEGWAGLSILDAQRAIRGELSCGPKGDSGLAIWDSKKRTRATLRVDEEDKVKLELADENGKATFRQPKE